MKNIVVTKEFEELYNLLEVQNKNVILFGGAGTGKSTFLNWFKNKTKKNVIVLAPTGIAALNIGGQTIHSMFRFPLRPLTPGDIESLSWSKKQILKHADIIVIDEISMVKADILDSINWSLQINLGSKKKFAGKQILLMGDMFQLPPIVTNDVSFFYKQVYNSPYFFDSQIYKKMNFVHFSFEQVFRQANKEFVDKLNDIRFAQVKQDTLDYFNRRCQKCEEENILTITSYINSADLINRNKLEQIKGDKKVYKGTTWGKFKWDKSKTLTPLELELKIGAQVIFTKNDENERFKNGMIGKLVYLGNDRIGVEVDGKEIVVTKTSWEMVEPVWNENENKFDIKEVGGFEQYPLALGWAITIHKSQAQTYDKVKIDLGKGAFAPGQLYVALSRCKEYNNIYLTQPIKISDIFCDNVLLKWWKTVDK